MFSPIAYVLQKSLRLLFRSLCSFTACVKANANLISIWALNSIHSPSRHKLLAKRIAGFHNSHVTFSNLLICTQFRTWYILLSYTLCPCRLNTIVFFCAWRVNVTRSLSSGIHLESHTQAANNARVITRITRTNYLDVFIAGTLVTYGIKFLDNYQYNLFIF